MTALEKIPIKFSDFEVEKKDGNLYIMRDRKKNATTSTRILLKLRLLPRFSKFDIEDDVGIFVWERINGSRTVGKISEEVFEKFSKKFEDTDLNQVTQWTIKFFKILASRRLIYYV